MAAGPRGARRGNGAQKPFRLPCLAAVPGGWVAGDAKADASFSLGSVHGLDSRARFARDMGGDDGGGVRISEEGPEGEELDSRNECPDE